MAYTHSHAVCGAMALDDFASTWYVFVCVEQWTVKEKLVQEQRSTNLVIVIIMQCPQGQEGLTAIVSSLKWAILGLPQDTYSAGNQ